MQEKIKQIPYAGMDQVPADIKKRIMAGDSDQHVHDVRPEIIIAGAPVPERVLEIELFDAREDFGEEHTVYAAINPGRGALISIVSATGKTPESARWKVGNNYNIPTLKEAYRAHRYVDPPKRWNETSIDGE